MCELFIRPGTYASVHKYPIVETKIRWLLKPRWHRIWITHRDHLATTKTDRVSKDIHFDVLCIRPRGIAVSMFIFGEHFKRYQLRMILDGFRCQHVLALALEVDHFAVERPIVRIPRSEAHGDLCEEKRTAAVTRVIPIDVDIQLDQLSPNQHDDNLTRFLSCVKISSWCYGSIDKQALTNPLPMC